MIDLAVSIVVSLFAFRGWRRSFLLSALALLELVVGYLAIYFFHGPMGQLLGKLFSLQPLVAYPLGGLAAFVLGVVVVSLLTKAVRRRRRYLERRGSRPILPARLLGAALGGAYGVALSMLVVWGLLLFQAVMPDKAPDARSSRIGQIAAPWLGKVTAAAVRRASGSDTLSATASRAARDPVGAARDLKTVVSNRRVQALVANPSRLKALARTKPEDLVKHPTFKRLARDRKFVAAASRLGLLQGVDGELTPDEIRRQLANRAAPLSRAVTSLSEDKEVRSLLKDPDLMRKLQRKDIASLLNDPKFNSLAQKVLEKLRAAREPLPAEAPDEGK